MADNAHSLKKILGRTDILTLAFGTMIGWGWVMLSALWIREAGVIGSLIAFGIGALFCILVGLTYAEMTAALPLEGGEMVYTYRALGPGFGYFVGWTISFAYIGVAAWEGIAIATAFDYILMIPDVGYLWNISGYPVYASWSIVGMVGALILAILNHFGIKPAAILQVMSTSFLFLVGLIFLFGGIAFGNLDYMQPAFTGRSGMIAVLLMVPSMFVGFDVIPQSAEELNLPLRQISKVFIISIVMAAAWYFIIILGISLSAPPEVRNAGLVPAADAMSYSYGSGIFGKIMILGGICGIMTSWNGFIAASTRIINAMGRAKMLPPVFGRLHNTYKTPTGAIWLVGGICFLAPLLGRNALVWFVNASAFGTVLAYMMVAVSFLILRHREPNLNRPFKIRYGIVVSISVIVISIGLLFLYAVFGEKSFDWPNEGMLILIWAALGGLFAIWAKKKYYYITAEEQENLIFGEEYSRKEISDV